jgi:hypothetical protein
MTMTASQETISDTARRDGWAFFQAMQDWIDNYYDAVGHMVTIQREFIKGCWTATLPVAKTATHKRS